MHQPPVPEPALLCVSIGFTSGPSRWNESTESRRSSSMDGCRGAATPRRSSSAARANVVSSQTSDNASPPRILPALLTRDGRTRDCASPASAALLRRSGDPRAFGGAICDANEPEPDPLVAPDRLESFVTALDAPCSYEWGPRGEGGAFPDPRAVSSTAWSCFATGRCVRRMSTPSRGIATSGARSMPARREDRRRRLLFGKTFRKNKRCRFSFLPIRALGTRLSRTSRLIRQ